MNQQTLPTVTVIGAGGAGTNEVKRLIEKTKDMKFDSSVTYKVIDTSKSNLSGIENADIHSIGELGSGKDRTKNLQSIQRYLDTHTELSKNTSDITIIIASFGGGSGSCIGPVLTNRIMRHADDKAVIVVGIIDTGCERDCLNSIATIKSFNKIGKDLGISIPMLLFSNTTKVNDKKPGRNGVDKTIVSRLIQLINLLTSSDVQELDWTDKMTFLTPHTTGCDAGLCSLSISASDLEHTENLPGEMNITLVDDNIVHSLLVVNEDGQSPDILTNVNYVGVSTSKYISIMCEGIPSVLTQDLVDQAERYQHAAKIKTTMESDLEKYGSEDKTGLII